MLIKIRRDLLFTCIAQMYDDMEPLSTITFYSPMSNYIVLKKHIDYIIVLKKDISFLVPSFKAGLLSEDESMRDLYIAIYLRDFDDAHRGFDTGFSS